MVWHQEQVHGLKARRHQGQLLRGLNVTRQQSRSCAVADAQHTADRIGLGFFIQRHARGLRMRMKDLKKHPIPDPGLPGLAARPARPQAVQRVALFQRRPQRRLRLHGQHRRRAPGVVAVAVTQHQGVNALAHLGKQGHQHTVPRITFG